ncbi:MAG: hypothetical protein ACTHK7_08010 [Aureliella sp.]
MVTRRVNQPPGDSPQFTPIWRRGTGRYRVPVDSINRLPAGWDAAGSPSAAARPVFDSCGWPAKYFDACEE